MFVIKKGVLHHKDMYIKEIYIDNFGKLISTTFEFDNSINTIKTIHGAELTDALELVLGNKTDSRFLNLKTIVKATVNIEKTYYVEIKSKKLQAFDGNRADCTKDYLYLISHHIEENDASCFKNFKSKNFPHRLLKYKNTEKYYSGNEFATVTGGLGETKTFRSYLNSYIKNFESSQLIHGKEYHLMLNENGEFDVLKDNDKDIPLSESENMVYHFMSFIHLAKFWADIERMRDINHPLKPLIIPLFLEMLDENINASAFLSLAVSCERQAIFIDRSIFMNIPDKKKLKLDAVRLWCLTTGYEETNDEIEVADLSFIKNGYRTNFITEFDRTIEELLMAISNSKSNYIYIVTDDNAKRRKLIKVIPEYCGIFCDSNPFGLGMLTQILREPQFLEIR